MGIRDIRFDDSRRDRHRRETITRGGSIRFYTADGEALKATFAEVRKEALRRFGCIELGLAMRQPYRAKLCLWHGLEPWSRREFADFDAFAASIDEQGVCNAFLELMHASEADTQPTNNQLREGRNDEKSSR